MKKTNIIFIKKKDLNFARLLKETRLMECEVKWIRADCGLCSACGNPADPGDDFCPYCEIEFGAYFDLNLVKGNLIQGGERV